MVTFTPRMISTAPVTVQLDTTPVGTMVTQREIDNMIVQPVYMRTARRCVSCGTLLPINGRHH